jgi:hypothetical protein
MQINSIYDDRLIFLQQLGATDIKRASHVEPQGTAWIADMGPSGGPVLGPFETRNEALEREREWLINLWRTKLLSSGYLERSGGSNNEI